MRHVLEHLLNPLKALKKVESVLVDNGKIYIAVPNMSKPKGKLKKYWFRIVHVSYFSINSLIILTQKAGLKPLEINEIDSELYGIFIKSATKDNSYVLKNEYVRLSLFIY